MKKTLLLLLLLIGGITNQPFAQDQHLVDSLQTGLKTAKLDTTRVKIFYQLAKTYLGNNPEKAMDYARQSLALSEKTDYKKGMGNAYSIMGVVNTNKGDYLKALEFQKHALKIREEIGDKKGLAVSYSSIGIVFFHQGNYTEALSHFRHALKINQELGDKKGIASSFNKLGSVYLEQANYPEALMNLFAALKILEKLRDEKGMSASYTNIGSIYRLQGNYPKALKNELASLHLSERIGDKRGLAMSYNNIGIINKEMGNIQEAVKNYYASLKISEEMGDKLGVGRCYLNLGNVISKQGNDQEGLIKYLAAEKIFEEIGYKRGITTVYFNIGNTYTRLNKYVEAVKYLNKSLSLSKEIGSLEGIQDCYSGLARLYSAQGNFKKALEYYKDYIIIRDSMFGQENTKKIMQIEVDKKNELVKAEQEKRDLIAEKKLLIQKWVRNGFIGGFAVVLVFAFVFLRQRKKISREKKISEAEKERSEELLLNILPAEVAEELKSTGAAKAKTFSMVSVMFTDFKDFTRISEQVSAELLVDEIHYCFSAFDAIIQKYKIEKIKTIGDAYLCASGLPVLNYTHAEDLVNAAFEIRDFMAARKKEKESRREIPFELRIGIHTGPVVAGIVGVKKFAYDIWGDTVNIAARMEQNSEAGKINISGNTYQLVKDKFAFTHRGKIEAKNKGEIDMYFVESKPM